MKGAWIEQSGTQSLILYMLGSTMPKCQTAFATGCFEGCPGEGEQPGKCSTGSQQCGQGSCTRGPEATVCPETQQAAILRLGSTGTNSSSLPSMWSPAVVCHYPDTPSMHTAQAALCARKHPTLHAIGWGVVDSVQAQTSLQLTAHCNSKTGQHRIAAVAAAVLLLLLVCHCTTWQYC